MKAAEAVLSLFRRYGVRDVFGLPGETTLPLYRFWENYPDITYHMCRDERSSVFMADAYAKASGKVGVCEGPSVGATHMVPGVAEAYVACVPLVVLTSDIPLRYRMKNMLTGFDQTSLFKGITKETLTATCPEEVPELLRRAFREATTGRPGPVHLRIPSDVLEGEVDSSLIYAQPRFGVFPGCRVKPSEEDLIEAANLLSKARRPVMVCGQGALYSSAWDEIFALAEYWKIPVGTTINGKGAFPETHPLSIGVVGARGGRKWSNSLLKEADLVLFVGTSTDSAATDGWRIPDPCSGQIFLQIDVSERELGNNYDAFPLLGDAREVLKGLRSHLSSTPTVASNWIKRIADERANYARRTQMVLQQQSLGSLHPGSIMQRLRDELPQECFLAVDPGIAAVYSAAFFTLSKPGRWMAYNFAMGALGYAIPAAIGARLALRGGIPVIGLVGDGSFGFAAGELETAVRLKAQVSYLLFDNQAFGWIRGTEFVHKAGELGRGFDRFTRFSPVDYVKIAEGFGLPGYRVETLDAFSRTLRSCLQLPGPSLIVLPVASEEELLPPVPGWEPCAERLGVDSLY